MGGVAIGLRRVAEEDGHLAVRDGVCCLFQVVRSIIVRVVDSRQMDARTAVLDDHAFVEQDPNAQRYTVYWLTQAGLDVDGRYVTHFYPNELVSQLEVLDDERRALEASREAIRAREAHLAAWIALAKALGATPSI